MRKELGMRSIEVKVRDQEKISRTKIYFFPKGENVIEQVWKRRLRPHNVLYKPLLPEVIKLANLPEDVKFHWSQQAGCSCGCSPGFVSENHSGKDIFVDIEEEESDYIAEHEDEKN